VFVRPNQYEPGARANITIFNWALQSSVQVDLARAGFARGTAFELRDSQNYFGQPVVSGVYDGSPISVPMRNLTVVPPVGNIPLVPTHTAPQFGAFILVKTSTGGGTGTAPTASLSATPTSIAAGESTSLAWSTTNATQVAIDNGIGTVAAGGSASVSPASTTTYVLTAANSTGSVSRSVTVTVTPGGTTPPTTNGTAAFVKSDTTTAGNWKGVYGNAGYALNGIGTQPASWSQLGMTGNSSWTWDSNATDARALERPSGGRIAATWYSDSAFNVDVTVTDGEKRNVAFYMVDWDAIGRTQSVEVSDAVTGTVLDRQTVADFKQGGYWVWQISGAVRFRFAKVAGRNAVASGIFFDDGGPGGTSSNNPPSVALSLSGAQVAPATLALTANASDTDGTVSSVRFYNGSNLLTTDTTAPYSYSWSGVPAGTYQLTAVATDNLNATTTSSTVTATVTAPGGGGGGGTSPATATFAGQDFGTGGNWRNLFPTDDGHSIAQAIDTPPPYAKVTMQGHSSWMWNANPTDARALETSTGRRVASTWYSDSGFSIDVAISDGKPHRVALYALDWDAIGRAQTIEVLDAATGTRLDARTVSNFSGGQYLQWNVTGNVRFRMTRVTGQNAVISGIFFGPAGTTNPPPTVTVSSSGTLSAPASLTLTAAASDGDGIREVRFYSGTTLLSTDTTSPYQYAWSNVSAGTYQVTAAATDNLGATAVSAPISLTVRSGTGSGGATAATFAGFDAATRGSWKGVYGTEGFSLAAETNTPPSYAQITLAGHSSWTWQAFPTDPRALERAGTGRIAATWYSDSAFTIDVNVTDGASHLVGLYLLDWDNIGRSQQIDVLDAATNAVLDTRTVSSFAQGQYWVWQVSGHVKIRVSRLTGRNAVVGGIFFGAP
jgi:hypothetical protein